MTQPEIERRSPRSLVNTQPFKSMDIGMQITTPFDFFPEYWAVSYYFPLHGLEKL